VGGVEGVRVLGSARAVRVLGGAPRVLGFWRWLTGGARLEVTLPSLLKRTLAIRAAESDSTVHSAGFGIHCCSFVAVGLLESSWASWAHLPGSTV
jgi:hypothetical protein